LFARNFDLDPFPTWEHVRQNTILVERSASHGELKQTKTEKIRSVKLLAALRHDLNEWRAHSEDTSGLIFPRRTTGGPWTTEGYKSWESKSFKKAAKAAGRDDASPYTLRHSFASLLIREGRSIVEVAAQLGHAPTMTLDTYAHVFADLDEVDRQPAAEVIEQARQQVSREHLGKSRENKSGAMRTNPASNVLISFSQERAKRRLIA
jgi:integrase